jgi:hypothetical protein
MPSHPLNQPVKHTVLTGQLQPTGLDPTQQVRQELPVRTALGFETYMFLVFHDHAGRDHQGRMAGRSRHLAGPGPDKLAEVDISLLSYDEDPEDPIYQLPVSQADHRILPGSGYGKDQLEDLQLWACLTALTANQIVPGAIGVVPGGDPPDRILTVDRASYPLELTVLTIQQLRSRLGGVRQLARLVQDRVHESLPGYAHLTDRTVVIAAFDLDNALPPGTRRSGVADQIATALREDRGFMGHHLNASRIATAGFPDEADLSGGDYGEFAGLNVQAQQSVAPSGNPVAVVGAAQAEFRLSEVRALVKQVIARKDVSENRILLISAGAPDKDGFTCPLDFWLFDALWQHGLGGRPQPSHLDCVLMQAWGKPLVAELYRRPGATLPWPAPPAKATSGQLPDPHV